MLNFKFNPQGTKRKDPGTFEGVCTLVNLVYTTSKNGNKMVKVTWNHGGFLFDDYHSCYDIAHKQKVANWLGEICYKLGEDPAQFLDENPENEDVLLNMMCISILDQLKFKGKVKREKESNSNFFKCTLDIDSIEKV